MSCVSIERVYRGSRKLVQYGRELGVMCQHRVGVKRGLVSSYSIDMS